ncbi:hypothetical protein [Enterococcus sp. 5H]|uniref:hypothetical protein n=1 Tax=Enterococcus sp. 5H TaxID=1229490 RepID=UPI002304A676|nr:hypothetical protein [Enterococcus sp. 5H]MDA9471324.1 hypothetical protein [Enterococcus sp. 5H]
MISYTFEKWRYDDQSPTELIIVFTDKKNIGLEELLNVEGFAITLDDILVKIELVISGESVIEEIGTERSLAEIKEDTTTIYDLFEELVPEEEANPTIKIATLELKEIILDYQKHLKLFGEKE